MRRHAALLLLPTLTLLLAVPASAAEDFKDLKKAFTLAFRMGQPAAERLAVVTKLGELRTKPAAELLISGIPISQDILDDLSAQKQTVDRENRDLGGEYRHQIESKKLKVLLDEEYGVLDAIRSALTGMVTPKPLEVISRDALLKDKHWRVRETAARVLGKIAKPTTYADLLKALKDKDDRVQLAVANVVGELKIPEAVEGLVKLLSEKSWTVRAAAIAALGEIGERSAVGALVAHIGKEEGQVLEDCGKVLEKLTGQNFGSNADVWRKWWRDHREEFEGDGDLPFGEPNPEKPVKDDDTYYGIPLVTRKAIFILDISHSMVFGMKNAQEMPVGDELSKIDAAKKELIRTLTRFDSSGSFDVIAFNDRIFMWKPKMTPSTPSNKLELRQWVEALEAESTTNIYEALESAFRIAGMGATDKYYDLAFDTIFLLSDGTPTHPDGSNDDPDKVIRAVREWNSAKRVRIHTIGFSGHNIEFMTQLAEENGGKYVRR